MADYGHNQNSKNISAEEEDFIRQTLISELEELEVPPSEDAWKRISSRIQPSSSSASTRSEKRSASFWGWRVGAAAGILLLLGGALWFSGVELPFGGIFDSASPGEEEPMLAGDEEMEEAEREEPDAEVAVPEEFEEDSDIGAYGDVEDEDLDREDYTAEEYEQDLGIGDYPPGELNGFELVEFTESSSPLKTPAFIYERDEIRLWLVVLENPQYLEEVAVGEEQRSIPPAQLEDLQLDSEKMVEDELGYNVLIWPHDEWVLVLWPKTENINDDVLREIQGQLDWP